MLNVKVKDKEMCLQELLIELESEIDRVTHLIEDNEAQLDSLRQELYA